jgi:hypothetical protein
MADYQKTMNLLEKSSRSYSEIESDLGITKDQLTRLYNNNVVHPRKDMIQCLHDYLVREKKHRMRQDRKCGEKNLKDKRTAQ